MLSIVGSGMYSTRVPPLDTPALLVPSPDEPPLKASAALAADVCNGPLQPKSASAIRIVANLPLAVILITSVVLTGNYKLETSPRFHQAGLGRFAGDGVPGAYCVPSPCTAVCLVQFPGRTPFGLAFGSFV